MSTATITHTNFKYLKHVFSCDVISVCRFKLNDSPKEAARGKGSKKQNSGSVVRKKPGNGAFPEKEEKLGKLWW